MLTIKALFTFTSPPLLHSLVVLLEVTCIFFLHPVTILEQCRLSIGLSLIAPLCGLYYLLSRKWISVLTHKSVKIWSDGDRKLKMSSSDNMTRPYQCSTASVSHDSLQTRVLEVPPAFVVLQCLAGIIKDKDTAVSTLQPLSCSQESSKNSLEDSIGTTCISKWIQKGIIGVFPSQILLVLPSSSVGLH